MESQRAAAMRTRGGWEEAARHWQPTPRALHNVSTQRQEQPQPQGLAVVVGGLRFRRQESADVVVG